MNSYSLLIGLLIAFGAAKLGGFLMNRAGQSEVLGEILAGIAVGPYVLHIVSRTETLDVIAQTGIIILLFIVGAETSFKDLRRVTGTAVAVAITGVVIPFLLGFALLLSLDYRFGEAAFVGAAMVATSVGITARVLADHKMLNKTSSKIILAAAVIDDVLGLLTLVVVRKLTVSNAGLFSWSDVDSLIIIGAFIVGLIIADTRYKEAVLKRVEPLSWLITPFFFVLMGTRVDISAYMDADFLSLTLILSVLAVIGKLAGGALGAIRHGRRTMIEVGVGMVPRGEIGLIVAMIGLTTHIIGPKIYTAVVGMSFLTTFITPFLIRLVSEKPHRLQSQT